MAAVAQPTRGTVFLVGASLALAAAVFWSLAGVIVRRIDLPSVEVSFWRSVFMLLALLPLVLARPRQLARDLATSGWAYLASGSLLAITFVAFIVALGMTTVANVLFMFAAGPFITAILARLAVGEPARPATLIAAVAAFVGILLTLIESLRVGDVAGLLLALIVPVAFSANTVLMRRHRTVRPLPGLAIAALISALMTLPFAQLGALELRHLPWLILLGPMQLALGLYCFTRALRYLPAAQAALIGLLEIVLGPLWVWLAHGEHPGGLALVGGGIAVAAVLGNGIAELRRTS